MNAMPMLPPLPTFRPGNNGSKTILVVDDYAPICDYVGRHLADIGYRVLPANGAEEAHRIIRSFTGTEVDLLLIDAEMPGRSGQALAAWFAKERPGTPILFMSALPEDFANRAGASILEKPFSIDELRTVVRKAVEEEFRFTHHDNAIAEAIRGQAA